MGETSVWSKRLVVAALALTVLGAAFPIVLTIRCLYWWWPYPVGWAIAAAVPGLLGLVLAGMACRQTCGWWSRLAQLALALGVIGPLLCAAQPLVKARWAKKVLVVNSVHLKQLGMAVLMYSGDHGGWNPDDWADVIEGSYIGLGEVFVSPHSGTPAPRTVRELLAGQTDYVYVGAGMADDIGCGGCHAGWDIVAYTRPGLIEGGFVMLYADGHVDSHRGPTIDAVAKAAEASLYPPWNFLCRYSALREHRVAADLSQAPRITDGRLAALAGCKWLSELTLTGCPVTDVGLAALGKATGLDRLELQGTRVTDAGLVHVRAWPKMVTLGLAQTAVGDAGLPALSTVPELEKLNLSRTTVTDAGLAHLAGLGNLEELDLSGTKVTDDGLRHLLRLKRLCCLNLADTQVTDVGVAQLAGLPELRVLGLARTKVTGAGLKPLTGLAKLWFLGLDGTAVGDRDVPCLEQFPRLRYLEVAGTALSSDGWLRLRAGTRELVLRDLESRIAFPGPVGFRLVELAGGEKPPEPRSEPEVTPPTERPAIWRDPHAVLYQRADEKPIALVDDEYIVGYRGGLGVTPDRRFAAACSRTVAVWRLRDLRVVFRLPLYAQVTGYDPAGHRFLLCQERGDNPARFLALEILE